MAKSSWILGQKWLTLFPIRATGIASVYLISEGIGDEPYQQIVLATHNTAARIN